MNIVFRQEELIKVDYSDFNLKYLLEKLIKGHNYLVKESKEQKSILDGLNQKINEINKIFVNEENNKKITNPPVQQKEIDQFSYFSKCFKEVNVQIAKIEQKFDKVAKEVADFYHQDNIRKEVVHPTISSITEKIDLIESKLLILEQNSNQFQLQLDSNKQKAEKYNVKITEKFIAKLKKMKNRIKMKTNKSDMNLIFDEIINLQSFMLNCFKEIGLEYVDPENEEGLQVDYKKDPKSKNNDSTFLTQSKIIKGKFKLKLKNNFGFPTQNPIMK